MATKRKTKRPTGFKANGFQWEIKFLDLDHDNFGETDKEKKIIYIYTKNHTEQIIVETLIHELCHAVIDDMADVIFHLDYDKNVDKEEQLIRLLTPRMFQFVQENGHVLKYIIDNATKR